MTRSVFSAVSRWIWSTFFKRRRPTPIEQPRLRPLRHKHFLEPVPSRVNDRIQVRVGKTGVLWRKTMHGVFVKVKLRVCPP